MIAQMVVFFIVRHPVDREPDLTTVAYVPDGQTVHADAHDPPVVGLRSAVFREELQLPDVAFLVERLDCMLPLLALRVVQFAEVERLTLEDSTTARRCYVRTFVLK